MKTNIFKTFAKTITTGFLCATVICGSVCGNMGGNVPPVKRGCLLDIVRLGGHDFANVGNVLAVVLKHKNPQNEMVTLVLISQIFPCKDDKCKDKLQSSLGNIKFSPPFHLGIPEKIIIQFQFYPLIGNFHGILPSILMPIKITR